MFLNTIKAAKHCSEPIIAYELLKSLLMLKTSSRTHRLTMIILWDRTRVQVLDVYILYFGGLITITFITPFILSMGVCIDLFVQGVKIGNG